mmetsp:Transcript_21889/g.68561  ORF Transcript_21889/g.68561 Transcript_21889/m.68561 type:complete len:393 (+) Transcript_21889:2754-3932(+)
MWRVVPRAHGGGGVHDARPRRRRRLRHRRRGRRRGRRGGEAAGGPRAAVPRRRRVRRRRRLGHYRSGSRTRGRADSADFGHGRRRVRRLRSYDFHPRATILLRRRGSMRGRGLRVPSHVIRRAPRALVGNDGGASGAPERRREAFRQGAHVKAGPRRVSCRGGRVAGPGRRGRAAARDGVRGGVARARRLRRARGLRGRGGLLLPRQLLGRGRVLARGPDGGDVRRVRKWRGRVRRPPVLPLREGLDGGLRRVPRQSDVRRRARGLAGRARGHGDCLVRGVRRLGRRRSDEVAHVLGEDGLKGEADRAARRVRIEAGEAPRLRLLRVAVAGPRSAGPHAPPVAPERGDRGAGRVLLRRLFAREDIGRAAFIGRHPLRGRGAARRAVLVWRVL